MVFQNYALYPHLSVYDNMAYGLKIQKLSKAEIDERVRNIASVIGLEELLDRKPKALSGGQRQRVAMGRAIVREPKVFLMDEPLSNLDAKLRVQMRSEVARIQHELAATTVYVTHDQVEAMTMGDRVALMRRGVLQQVDTPMRLYNAPANLFVASFIGSPSMNLFEAQLNRRNGHLVAKIGDQFLRLDPEALADPGDLERYDGRTVALGIRPEHLEDAAVETGAPPERRLKATVTDGRGARRRADRAPRGRRPPRPDRRGQGDRGRPRRHRGRRARGRGRTTPSCRSSGASTSPRARARASRSRWWWTRAASHFFDIDTGAAIGGHPAVAEV